MVNYIKTYFALVLTAVTFILSGCIFEYPDCPVMGGKEEITIINNWRFAPDASPEGMAYLFYRDDIRGLWRFDFPGRQAGKVFLNEGSYRFLMYNDDTSHVVFDTDHDGMLIATTSDAALQIDGLDEKLRVAPDMMWGGSIKNLFVGQNGLSYQYVAADGTVRNEYSQRMILYTQPRQLTPVYTVRVLKTVNWSGVESCTGLITGMASGIELFGDRPQKASVAINFNPAMNPDSVLTGVFRNFGLPSESEFSQERNEIRLYFRLSDKRVICRIFDMTDDIRAASNPMNVSLIIDSITLPLAPPVIKGGGFDADVSPWKEIEVNYET